MDKPINYRQLSQELETILDNIQSGDLDIDDAMKQYEKGMTIIKQLEQYLGKTENQVKKLKQRFDA